MRSAGRHAFLQPRPCCSAAVARKWGPATGRDLAGDYTGLSQTGVRCCSPSQAREKAQERGWGEDREHSAQGSWPSGGGAEHRAGRAEQGTSGQYGRRDGASEGENLARVQTFWPNSPKSTRRVHLSFARLQSRDPGTLSGPGQLDLSRPDPAILNSQQTRPHGNEYGEKTFGKQTTVIVRKALDGVPGGSVS